MRCAVRSSARNVRIAATHVSQFTAAFINPTSPWQFIILTKRGGIKWSDALGGRSCVNPSARSRSAWLARSSPRPSPRESQRRSASRRATDAAVTRRLRAAPGCRPGSTPRIVIYTADLRPTSPRPLAGFGRSDAKTARSEKLRIDPP